MFNLSSIGTVVLVEFILEVSGCRGCTAPYCILLRRQVARLTVCQLLLYNVKTVFPGRITLHGTLSSLLPLLETHTGTLRSVSLSLSHSHLRLLLKPLQFLCGFGRVCSLLSPAAAPQTRKLAALPQLTLLQKTSLSSSCCQLRWTSTFQLTIKHDLIKISVVPTEKLFIFFLLS